MQPMSNALADKRMCRYIFHYRSPLGGMTMASDGAALCGLWFDEQKYFGGTITAEPQTVLLPVFEQTVSWLELYFGGRIPDFAPALKLCGTAFRKEVWRLLLELPYGQVTTYGALAERLVRQQKRLALSAQAVGGAVGHNPIALLVPCHRVIGADGSLTGYAGGLDRKKYLLALERETMLRLSKGQADTGKKQQPLCE